MRRILASLTVGAGVLAGSVLPAVAAVEFFINVHLGYHAEGEEYYGMVSLTNVGEPAAITSIELNYIGDCRFKIYYGLADRPEAYFGKTVALAMTDPELFLANSMIRDISGKKAVWMPRMLNAGEEVLVFFFTLVPGMELYFSPDCGTEVTYIEIETDKGAFEYGI